MLCTFAYPAFSQEQFKSENDAQQYCPDDTVVWLNLRSGSVHAKGQPWYGKTQVGAYVCRNETGKNAAKPEKPLKPVKQAEITAWVRVIQDEKRTVYASATPLERSGDKVTILSMVDLKHPTALSEGRPFLSWQTQYEFDCKNMQSRVIAASMFSDNMGAGEVTDSIVHKAPRWEAIPLHSNGEALWRRVCRKN